MDSRGLGYAGEVGVGGRGVGGAADRDRVDVILAADATYYSDYIPVAQVERLMIINIFIYLLVLELLVVIRAAHCRDRIQPAT